jgi:uncharacterized protein (TIGR03118 family)
MKKKTNRTKTSPFHLLDRRLLFAAAALLLSPVSLLADNNKNHSPHYVQSNLVSDVPGAALVTDNKLLNAWGISFAPTGPFWVSANGTGRSMLYAVVYTNGQTQVAKQSLEVFIPGEGDVTGQLFDGSGSFNGDIFIFVSEDGTISGWRPALGTAAETLATHSNAIYKGVAMVNTAAGPTLLAADFHGKTVDAYDTNLTLIAQFVDSAAPAKYAPFNVQSVAGHVFVTFAKQDQFGEDDVSGPGHGLIDILNPRTGKLIRFATGSDAGGKLKEIDSPWGIALAPQSFGKHGGELLVGNFGSGTIMGFDGDGKFRGLLQGTKGQPIQIDDLWGLTFGNGGKGGSPKALYFSAGPDDESHGLFGSLESARDDDDN